jgi:hypothetical protein
MVSEREPQSELHFAHRARVPNLAELRRVARRHRIVQVDDVERVGRLGAQLQLEALGPMYQLLSIFVIGASWLKVTGRPSRKSAIALPVPRALFELKLKIP